jgi:hypothetical protein
MVNPMYVGSNTLSGDLEWSATLLEVTSERFDPGVVLVTYSRRLDGVGATRSIRRPCRI